MSLAAAIFVAVAVGAGTWLLLRGNLFDVLLGVALLSQGINLSVLASSGYRPEVRPPLVATAPSPGGGPDQTVEEAVVAPESYADPLPQALVLTAIVIGFALLSFLAVLTARRLDTGESPKTDGFETEDDP